MPDLPAERNQAVPVKHRTIIPPEKRRFNIPSDLAEAVEVRLFDPVLQRRKYGALSELVTQLLTEWVARTPVNPLAQAYFDKEKRDAAAEL